MASVMDGSQKFISTSTVLGLNGPVWTMIMWAAVALVNYVASIFVSPHEFNMDTVALIASSVYMVALIITLSIMKNRTPMWFIHTQIFMMIVVTCTLAYTSDDAIEVLNGAFAFFGVVIYSSYWTSRRDTVRYSIISAIGWLIAITASGRFEELILSWLILVTACAAIGYGFATLVMHLRRDTILDKLTGLLNRNGLQMILDLNPVGGRNSLPRTLVVVDLDGFKQLNDTEGHLAGDALLRDLGKAWRSVMRPDDAAIRSGGDEFMFILPKTDEHGAKEFVKRLKSVSPCEWSHGITVWKNDETFDAALKRADEYLYEDKRERKKGKERTAYTRKEAEETPV